MDWDYPGTARTFGWDMRTVQQTEKRDDFDYFAKCGIRLCDDCNSIFYPMETGSTYDNEQGYRLACPKCGGITRDVIPCDHAGTDGTVPCKDCGLTASDFMSAAYDWLHDHDGAETDDPGYFE
jgi:hypothetical protein